MTETKTAVMEAPAVHVKKTQKETDMQMVKGRFRCFEPQGGGVKLSYRRHKGEPIRTYEFNDGGEYTIPLGLARHLRDNCNYYKHTHIMDMNGNPIIDQRSKRVDRMTFEPLGFMPDGEF
jgi:hypothetical protein